MSWLLLIRATLLLLLALALDLALRRAPAVQRHLLWSTTILLLLALPLLTLLLPPLALEILPALAEPTPMPSVPLPPIESRSEIELGPLVSGIWVAGVLLCLGRLGFGLLAVRRLRRHARPAAGWETTLAGELGIRRPVELLLCGGLASPMTAGLLRPRIFLPATAAGWSPERRRVVLLHELIHVRRADWLLEILAQLCRALYWFHPLIWLAVRRAGLAREQACDEGVVSRGLRPSEYARHLLAIAEAPAGPPVLLPALSMTQPTHLERRLMSILQAPHRSRRGLVSSLAILLVLGAAALTLAAAEPKPVPPTPPAAPVAPAPPMTPAPSMTPAPPVAPLPPAPPEAPTPPAELAPLAPIDEAELAALTETMAEMHAELEAHHRELQEEHRAELETARAELETQRAELEQAREELEREREELEREREQLRREGSDS